MLCTSNMHWFCMFLSCALFLLPLWASTGPGHALSLYWVQYNCNRTGYKPYNIYMERDIFGRKKVFIVQGATMEAILLCVCAQKYSYIVYMISETLNTQNGNSQMRHILHCTAHCSAHTHTHCTHVPRTTGICGQCTFIWTYWERTQHSAAASAAAMHWFLIILLYLHPAIVAIGMLHEWSETTSQSSLLWHFYPFYFGGPPQSLPGHHHSFDHTRVLLS